LPSDNLCEDIYGLEVSVLNSQEEFSSNVLHYETQGCEPLRMMHSVFVQTVEMHVATLFYIREIEHGRPLYSNTIELYLHWVNSVNKKSNQDRYLQSEYWQSLITQAGG
jgi:hypothetical protein